MSDGGEGRGDRAGKRAGRPGATSRETIEAFAFGLFAQHGYEGTSMAMIADGLGIGRRTLFRYFPSKHDIAWGRFDVELERLASALETAPAELSARQAVMHALLELNATTADSSQHAVRMRLILGEPSLQSHSAARYEEWRRVIEVFVRRRLDSGPGDPRPALIAYVANAVAIAAYSQWVRDPGSDIAAALSDMDRLLRESLE